MIAGLWGGKASDSSNPPPNAPKHSPNSDAEVTEAPEPPSAPAPEAATPEADIADTGLMGLGLPPPAIEQGPSSQPSSENTPANPTTANIGTLKRPPISRGTSAPIAAPLQPPPPAPGAPQQPPDSLTLTQLKRLVADFPQRNEPTIYAYTYTDTASFEEEIDEWFAYGTAEYTRLNRCKIQFGTRWKSYSQKGWSEETWERKGEFVRRELDILNGKKGDQTRRKSVQRLMHILLGVWDESAGQGKALSLVADHEENKREGEPQIRSQATKSHLEGMKDGVKLITEVAGVKGVYDALRTIMDGVREDDYREAREAQTSIPDEVDNIMTILYIIIEITRCYPSQFTATKSELASLQPSLLTYLLTTLSTLRWDDPPSLPQTHLFLLFWKSLLLLLGSMSALDTVKSSVAESLQQTDRKHELITASPLDYHIFRQEITSKYPAYVPPQPLLPLDAEDTNILPTLHPKEQKSNGPGGVVVMPVAASSGSILHQPVHIATPAPSPPPSPPVGGKAGKKQNYQTNQNFPFLYPPLDSTSSSAGGKGPAGLKHELVGRKWEGSEIPASILEAGELFATRTKMTRAMRQLWDEREAFLKYERGWDSETSKDDLDEDLDVDELHLEEVLMKRLEKLGMSDDDSPPPKKKLDIDTGPRQVDDEVRLRLETVEEFFIDALPHLQSLVIVLLKNILQNVTHLVTQPLPGQNPAGGLQSSYQSEVNLRVGVPGMARARPGTNSEQQNSNGSNGYDVSSLPEADLEALRQREISLKAVSGILLTLLKWFKVSHILKFEYMTQLLLDANYVPLVLKYFAHADVDKLVDTDPEKAEKTFFGWCNKSAKKSGSPTGGAPSIFSGMGMGMGGGGQNPTATTIDDDTDEDDAAPPPIKVSRSPLTGLSSTTDGGSRRPAGMPPNPRTASAIHSPLPRSQIDDSGNLIPSTTYSARNFLSSINLLRVMHKTTASKTHRLLLLVQYKSSAILKKALKVQGPMIRKYTLKLFKGQVSFCGRKWRQGNMRVITQVYLELRPQLREEWLSGGEVEGRVEESGQVEVAGRSIVGWGLGRRYKEVLRGGRLEGHGEDEPMRDFFRRELERMAWAGEVQEEEEVEDGDDWEGVGLEMLRELGQAGQGERQQSVVDAGNSWAQGGKWTPRP